MGKKKLTKGQRSILRDMVGYLRYRIAANEGFWETIGVLENDVEVILGAAEECVDGLTDDGGVLDFRDKILRTFNYGDGWED